jgi:hypothetical protein
MARGEEAHETVNIFELPDGRGWLHDYDPEDENTRTLQTCVIVRAIAPAGTRLGLTLEEPDLTAGGGHTISHIAAESQLLDIVKMDDLLMVVDEAPVMHLPQAKLIEFLQSRGSSDKTLIFLRPVPVAEATKALSKGVVDLDKLMCAIDGQQAASEPGSPSDPVRPSIGRQLSFMVQQLFTDDSEKKKKADAEPVIDLVEFQIQVPAGLNAGQQFKADLDEYGTTILTVPSDEAFDGTMTVRIPKSAAGPLEQI